MKIIICQLVFFFLLSAGRHLQAQAVTDNKQQYASIGNFALENGQTILDCKIGYRTYGKLNSTKSNAIIFPTYFTGSSKDLQNVVPGKLIDTTSYFVITIDALGDGYSSSPSNSAIQPRLQFPVFSIKDMVESQYKMLTEKMGIQHLAAVAGISMGGMQAFQWAVSHPACMDKVITVVGSPQLTSYDLQLWGNELQAIVRDTAYHDGNYTTMPALKTVNLLHNLHLTTPQYTVNHISRDSINTYLNAIENNKNFDWNNWRRQLEAMMKHNVASVTGGLGQAAGVVQAKMLIIAARQDQMVNPKTAIAFAGFANAQLYVLENDCGHLAFSCEREKVVNLVRSFLSQ